MEEREGPSCGVSMDVLILGVDHEIQIADALRPDAMKNEYRGLLERLIGAHKVEFIGEEAHPLFETVGEQPSNALYLSRPWKNINMPEAERKAAGISEEQNNRKPSTYPGTVKTHIAKDGYYKDLKDGNFEFTPRVRSDAVKEDYMFKQAMEGAQGAASIIVLCGTLHTEEIAERFRKERHSVKIDALHNYNWYM